MVSFLAAPESSLHNNPMTIKLAISACYFFQPFINYNPMLIQINRLDGNGMTLILKFQVIVLLYGGIKKNSSGSIYFCLRGFMVQKVTKKLIQVHRLYFLFIVIERHGLMMVFSVNNYLFDIVLQRYVGQHQRQIALAVLIRKRKFPSNHFGFY